MRCPLTVRTASYGRDSATNLSDSLFNAFLMLSGVQMTFEIVHSWFVQLFRAVMAANLGQVVVFDVLPSLEIAGSGDRHEIFRVDRSESHHSFKRVVGVG